MVKFEELVEAMIFSPDTTRLKKIEVIVSAHNKEIVDSLKLPEIDEVVVSKLKSKDDSVGKWMKVGSSDEALYGWNCAREYLKNLKKKLK